MRPPAEDSRHHRLAPVGFVLVMFALTWAPAAALDPLWPVAADPPATQLLRASVLYAALMTLQPLVSLLVVSAVFGGVTVSVGQRRPHLHWQLLAVVGPLLLTAAAAALAILIGEADRAAGAAVSTGDPNRADGEPTQTFFLVLGFAGAIGLLWLQATTEEIGWRGYFLPRLMRELGPWTGLVAHGALWGLWYAPLLLVATGTDMSSLARCAAFVVTCSLLGVLLGWIRIAARSVLVAASANATLTICAALPLFLHGTSAPRTGIFLPIGWVPLGLAVLAVLATRHRRDIREFVQGPEC